MTRIVPPRHPNAQLLPTLFDRLRDDAPGQLSENPDAYVVSRAQMSQIIRRDLTFLLNATSLEDEIDRERYPAAACSTLNFGVPSLAGHYISGRTWTDSIRAIRRAIEEFEPRLEPGSLTVRLIDKEGTEKRYNMLRFEISGAIHMNPYPMAFTVQSSLDLETGTISIMNFHAN